MARKSSTKQDGEATTEEMPGLIVTYTKEEINTFKDDMASENTKKSTSTSVRRLQSWYFTELNLNSISKTFQGTYFILIAMFNFQCFRLDTSFLQFCHRRGKRCKLFSFSSKWFGNLKKDIIYKRLVNSVKYHYLSLRLVCSLFTCKKFENKCKNKHKIQTRSKL